MKIKFFAAGFVLLTGLFFVQTNLAKAQFTLLPYTQKDDVSCKRLLDEYASNGIIPSKLDVAKKDYIKSDDEVDNLQKELDEAKKAVFNFHPPQNLNALEASRDQAQAKLDAAVKRRDQAQEDAKKADESPDRENLLGCAVKTGRVSLQMVPYFVVYLINFILSLIGLVSVLFIVIGGYYYVFGGLTEDKEKGKKTIYHALLGMAVALLAWTIVNVIIRAVTG